MDTRHLHPSGSPCRTSALEQPFDQHLSRKLDDLIIALEASPPRRRQRILRLHKRWLEVRVPAYRPNGGTR